MFAMRGKPGEASSIETMKNSRDTILHNLKNQACCKSGIMPSEHHKRELGRPMLSAAVVHKESLVPEQWFFTLARALGLFTGDDRNRFYIEELRKVHDFWASHEVLPHLRQLKSQGSGIERYVDLLPSKN